MKILSHFEVTILPDEKQPIILAFIQQATTLQCCRWRNNTWHEAKTQRTPLGY